MPPRSAESPDDLPLPSERWGRRVAFGVVAVAAVVLAWAAFLLHPVGDYYTESDFYGWYAAGARMFLGGHPDPARYPVVGPGFDAAVALVSSVVREPFTAAKLVSVASAIGTLALWASLLARRMGPWAAAWSVAFLAALPVFGRYAYSATTDMLGTFLAAACAWLLLSGIPRRPALAAAAAGGVAALATLTRYNAIALVPTGVGLLWVRPASVPTARGISLFLAGFLVVAGPWWAFALAKGHPPGHELFDNFGFYSTADAARNIQDSPQTPPDAPRSGETLADVVRRDPIAMATRTLGAMPDHLRHDAVELLGLPAAACALAGLVALVAFRSVAPLAPVAAIGAGLFGTLLLTFYSDRYSLPLAPAYLALVGGLASVGFARSAGRWGLAGVWTLMGLALVATVSWSVDVQRRVLEQAPAEVVPAGRAIAAVAHPGDRVLSRKGHVGYYASLETVSFPRVATLEELGDHARRAGADFLYYSWYECFIRPEFAYLLDSTAAVPGLTRVYASDANPAVAFRIGPELGRPPAWMSDSTQLAVHRSRALVRVLPPAEAWSDHIVLAVDAAARDRWDEVLRHGRAATRAAPDSGLGWTVVGDALRRLRRFEQSREAYGRALSLDPNDADARLGLGWVELLSGHSARAAEVWRPVAGVTRDGRALAAMARVFEKTGDRQSLKRVQSARLAHFGEHATD